MGSKFVKVLDFELRAIIYKDNTRTDAAAPFVELRRKDGYITANAISWPVEAEIRIGKRWFRRDISGYIQQAMARLNETIDRMNVDPKYVEDIRREPLW